MLTVQPTVATSTQKTVEGQPATIGIQAASDSVVSVQLYQLGGPDVIPSAGFQGTKIEGATGYSYTFPSVTNADRSKFYIFDVQNAGGEKKYVFAGLRT